MDVLLDLKRNQMIFPGNMTCKLKNNSCGHSELIWKPKNITNTYDTKQCSDVFPAQCDDMLDGNEDSREPIAPSTQVVKLHKHLGHADIPTLCQIIKQDGFKNTRLSVDQAVASCPCEKRGSHPQNPILPRYQAQYPGQCVCLEIYFTH